MASHSETITESPSALFHSNRREAGAFFWAAQLRVGMACTGCGACIITCPTNAFKKSAEGLSIEASACNGCYECVEVCPRGAIAEGDGPPDIEPWAAIPREFR